MTTFKASYLEFSIILFFNYQRETLEMNFLTVFGQRECAVLPTLLVQQA